jgi:uncharacterized protein
VLCCAVTPLPEVRTVSHVSLITLGVEDLGRATSFYTALGWAPSSASVPGVVTFLRGGTVALSLFGRDALHAEAGTALAPSPSTIALAVNLPDEAEVDAFVATAESHGATVTAPPSRTAWGGYSGYLTDPDGHLWEVAHNPGWELAADGRVDLP